MKTITSDDFDKWIHAGEKILNDLKIPRKDDVAIYDNSTIAKSALSMK